MSATQKLLLFGVFELNLDTEELSKSETVVKLPPQPVKLLALLASHAGQVVSRDQIHKRLWADDSEVDFEHVVNKYIKQIRTVLGDNADSPLYIETLPRHGYRFIAPVVSKVIPAPRPKVVESDSGDGVRMPVLTGGGAGVAAAAGVAPIFSATVPDAEAAEPQSRITRARDSRSRIWRAPLLWIGVAVVLVASIGGGLYWRAHKISALTEKDTLVLAEFDNKTGDNVFDGTLRQGLRADLEQSPFLNVLSDQHVLQTMAFMTQPKDARLTPELAREVCIRTGSAATLEGSIAAFGKEYVVGLKAVDCHSGDEIAVEQFTVDSKEKVLPALGKAASRIRRKLGESLASVQKYDVPLENVTTPSLEALQAYSQGYQAFSAKNDFPTAILLLQQAINLDPNFAMAYAILGTCYGDMGEAARAAENMRKAYELREKTSEREKLYIVSHYEGGTIGNLEADRKTSELWAQVYPRDEAPATHLGGIYFALGDYDKAVAAFQESLKLDPGSGYRYVNLILAYLETNRLTEAREAAREAQAHHLDNPAIHGNLYLVDFLQHDVEGMKRDAAALMGKPGLEDVILYDESDTAAYAGRFSEARELTRRAADSAQRADEKETAAGYKSEAAVREALVGNLALAKQEARAALALSNGRDVEAMSAVALALAGDTAQATRLAGDLAKRFPQDTIVQFEYLPMIRAAAALGVHTAKGPQEAIEALTAAAPYELGYLVESIGFALYPVYFRGEAYLQAQQGAPAAAEFQKILDHPGVVANEPIGALAHLGLGRAYAFSGDTAKAKAAYQDFLTIWKDADPDIPIYKQAKAEYARLR